MTYVELIFAKFDGSVLLTPRVNKEDNCSVWKMGTLQPCSTFQLFLLLTSPCVTPPSVFSVAQFQNHWMTIITGSATACEANHDFVGMQLQTACREVRALSGRDSSRLTRVTIMHAVSNDGNERAQ